MAHHLMPSRLQPVWSRFSALGPFVLVAVIMLPMLLGGSQLSVPLHWVGELLSHVAGP